MPLTPIRRSLANGATLIVQENHTSPSVSLLAVVAAGGYDDPADREGTAALVARTIDRGTRTRTADDIADDLDGRGASLSVSAGRHQIGMAATCLVEDFAAVLGTVSELMREPVFPDRDVATRRAEHITTIRQEDDDPASVATDRLMQELYVSHAYGRRVRGTVASVQNLGRDDLVWFHTARFRPSALTLVAVGSLPAEAMLDATGEAFGSWLAEPGSPAEPVPDAPASSVRRRTRVVMPDKYQADVAYGFVGIRRSDPAFMPASVMNNILGQYALGGRLGDNIRERQGMAYYVFSSLDAGLGPGPLTVRAGVATENVDRTVASIDHELEMIRSQGFTEQEVADSKQYLAGALPRQLETSAGVASFLLNAETFGLGLDYDRRFLDLIRAVSRDPVVDQARRLLDPARATIVVAGPEAPAP
ncbi:MAG TPA: pitrilysin family protein [Vicinamibacterales bacterium]|nr:pitrilysin family protein [Vicinamibacterales bacterium]